jgi:uncharacterized protein YhfF
MHVHYINGVLPFPRVQHHELFKVTDYTKQAPFKYFCSLGIKKKIGHYKKRLAAQKKSAKMARAKIETIKLEILQTEGRIKTIEHSKNLAECFLLTSQVDHYKDFQLFNNVMKTLSKEIS